MATSGTITGKCDNGIYTLTCEWSATQSVTNNTSTITAKVYLKSSGGASTISKTWDCTINGSQVTNNKSATVSGTKVLLGEKTWSVAHNSDGSCSLKISFSYSNGLTSYGTYTTKTGSGSGTIEITTIPRVSTFTLSKTTLSLGDAQTIEIKKIKSTSTHTITYTFGKTTTTIASKTSSTKFNFVLPKTLANEIPNATSGICTIKLATYNGTTLVGSITKTFTLKISSDIKPTITLTETRNNTLNGTYIAGKSTATIIPTGKGSYGSTIVSYSYSGAGLSGTGKSKTTKTLSAGTYTITVTAKDSRGTTNSASVTITVYGYSKPTCSVSGYRVDVLGNASPVGNYVNLKLKWNISNPNSKNANVKTFTIQYKKKTESSWKTHTKQKGLTTYSGTDNAWNVINVVFETTSSYDIKFTVNDTYNSAVSTCTISTITTILNMESTGVGIGKVRERGKLDIDGTVYIQNGTLNFTSSPSQYARIGYVLSTDANAKGVGYTFISNGNNNWLRLYDDKTITYGGNALLTGNLTASGDRWGVWSSINDKGIFECGKFLNFHESNGDKNEYSLQLSSSGGNLHSSGNAFYFSNDKARLGYNSTEKCTYIANANDSWLRLNDDGTLKWKGYVVHNGTSTTSDGRYKYILEDIKSDDCYELIKNTNIYAYSLLNKKIDDYSSINEISNELQNSSYMNIHMGVIAQDILDNELGKYIVIKHDMENGDYKYGIDNYAYVSTLHGALQQEIKLREQLQKEIDVLKKQFNDFK